MYRSTLRVALASALFVVASCGDSTSVTHPESLVTGDPRLALTAVSINVLLPSYSLAGGMTMQAHAERVDGNDWVVAGGTYLWSTDNPTVATVSPTGLVTGLSTGTVHVLATSSGLTGSATLRVTSGTVTPPPTTTPPPTAPIVKSVSVSLNSASLVVGGTTTANVIARDSSGATIGGRTTTWSSSAPLVATVSPAGLVTAVAVGSAQITATVDGVKGSATITVTTAPILPPPPPPVGSTEPRPTSSSTLLFRDDFERYDGSCHSLIALGGWATSDPNCGGSAANMTTPTGVGSLGTATGIGGHALRIVWPVSTSEQFFIAEHPVPGFSGRQPEYFSYDYRAPGFVYVAAYPRVGKKMFLLLIGGGQTGRVTINPTEWGMLQSNGVHLNPDFDYYPAGITSKAGYTAYLTNGQWHRYTIMRLPETSNGAMDGQVRMWVDGYLVVDYQHAGTYTGNTSTIDVAGTFNGGSSVLQTEYYDNVTAWR